MDYRIISASEAEPLFGLHRAYKAEIGEEAPSENELERLLSAIEKGLIIFFGAWDCEELVGCCSVTVGFSTFDYAPSGVFEDFYILPEYRHKGIARRLAAFAREKSGVSTLTAGCADCDIEMYRAIGFSLKIGDLMAYE